MKTSKAAPRSILTRTALYLVCAVACSCATAPKPSGPEGPGIQAARFEFEGINAWGREEYRDSVTGLVFVSVIASKQAVDAALLGGALYPDNDVVVLVSKYECTRDAWKRVMNELPHDESPPTTDSVFPSAESTDALPVAFVSYLDALQFCERSKLILPTHDLWMELVGGQERVPFAWGATPPSHKRAHYMRTGAAPVDAYPEGASREGVFGGSGNLSEWVNEVSWDRLNGAMHPCAGGSFASPRSELTLNSVLWLKRDVRMDRVGFRPCFIVRPH